MAIKVNYLNNRDLMSEIHKSKNTYCSFTLPEYHRYDLIVNDITDITEDSITEAKKIQAKRLTVAEFERRKSLTTEKIQISECEYDFTTIKNSDIIFRIMTYDHIPLNNSRKKNPKTTADHRDRVNFPPFQHWKFDDDDNLICVGKSHWIGDIDNGKFSKSHGKISDKLAKMYMKLCERYATRGNVRSYSYIDEMRNQAILQLVQVGLQFDESKSDNPFSYFTSIIHNGYVRVINVEKKNQIIRDELLEMNGLNPSFTRTADSEHEYSMRRELED